MRHMLNDIWGPITPGETFGDSRCVHSMTPAQVQIFTGSRHVIKWVPWAEWAPWWVRNLGQVRRHLPITPGKCSVHFKQSCWTLCDLMDCSMPGFPVHQQLPELAQTHVHQVSDALQPSHPLLYPSPPAFKLSQHQGLFQWVGSSCQVAKVLELQHQSFQWIFRTDFF